MRLIDADALIERIKYSFYPDERVSIETVTGCFLDETGCSPTVDAEPVRHGHWVAYKDNKRECYCSECDFPAGLDDYGYHNMQDPYCRFCGAKMDEVSE